MKALTWIGTRPPAVCAGFKKDLFLQPWQTAVRIAFRFETVWCVMEGDKMVLADRALLSTTTVYAGSDVLIGRNDAYQIGLDYSDQSKRFRAALEDRMREQAWSGQR